MAKAKEETTATTKKKKVADEAKKPAELESRVDDKSPVSDVPTKEEKATTAKAGKRSAKSLAEDEEKAAKEERKKVAKDESASEKPKAPVKPARSRLERRSKKYRDVASKIEKDKLYSGKEALSLVTQTSTTKFDATVEIHVRLGVDPRQADQNIRDNLVLPSGTGKTVRVAVFSEEDVAKEALKAGADVAGADDFLAQLDKGVVDFDVLIATPNVMVKLSKYARILGPKGLMPNPKSGTVTNDVAKAISASKAGKVEYRVDSTGIIHVGIGKVSFGADKLQQNLDALFASIKQNKPASLKGTYVRSIAITTTMGPSIKVQPSELS